jgi:hypothetical protein
MFIVYVAALCISGILLLVMAGVGFGQSIGMRVLDAVIGLAFLGYGGYLTLVFDGGEYTMFYYAFVVPIALVVKIFRNRSAVAAR